MTAVDLQTAWRLISAAVFVYDYLVTIPSELRLYRRQHVWYRPSLACILFAFARYIGVVYITYSTPVFFVTTFTLASCKKTFPVAALLRGVVSTASALVFLWRTWAIWGRNRTILIIMGVALLPTTVFTYSSGLMQVPHLTPSGGCIGVTGSTNVLALKWVFPLANMLYDAFACVMSSVRLIKHTRTGLSPVSTILLVDGIGYFIIAVALHGVNLHFLLSPNKDLQSTFTSFQAVMCSILAQRIITSLSERVTNKNTSHSESTRDRSKSRGRSRSAGLAGILSRTPAKPTSSTGPMWLRSMQEQEGKNVELTTVQIQVDTHVQKDGDEAVSQVSEPYGQKREELY